MGSRTPTKKKKRRSEPPAEPEEPNDREGPERSSMCRSKVTTMMMMMVMVVVTMMVAEAMPKPDDPSRHSAKSAKKGPAAVETVPLELDESTLVLTEISRPLENSSISPWTYNISSDVSLFPPLSEARCLLQGCLDPEGREDLSLESRPIRRQVLLLRKVGSQKGAAHSYHFRLESRIIAVGCTCIRPIVLHQQ